MSLLVRSKVLGLSVNTSTADDNYDRYNRENFRQTIKMYLSKTLKTFFQIFIAFLTFTSYFEHFKEKGKPQSLSIFEIMDSEKHLYLNV